MILSSVLPWSDDSYCGYSVLLQGIEMGHVPTPLHFVNLRSDLVNGRFKVAVQPALPAGVSLILGNDIAGGLVKPVVEVVTPPEQPTACDNLQEEFPNSFPACVVTRAQAKKLGNVCDLEDSMFSSMLGADVTELPPQSPVKEPDVNPSCVAVSPGEFSFPITSDNLKTAQRQDASLAKCFSSVVTEDQAALQKMAYVLVDGLLTRRWTSKEIDGDGSSVCQIVVPKPFRAHVLSLAHDNPWSGHLGVTKTYDRILRHFFWPGLKKEVADYCRSCHTCQLMGKPNQVIPPAPLHPIPVMGEPFERVLVDCVGPLPKAKSGHQFLLTMMCAATRYPEAIPMRKITAKAVTSALIKFFSTFGLPKVVQTDQGTNFMSRLFTQALRTLHITHQISSAYHPESQGALERWHQTLKAMLRKYCCDTGKDWDEGIPYVLFAIRETVQESLKFSPAELVFGHVVRGPLKVLKDEMMTSNPAPNNVLDYVSRVRERMHNACALAKEALQHSQGNMKSQFDLKAVKRSFEPGDQVLVLLPVPSSSLSARFMGPYAIEQKLSETDYVVRTPERRRQSRVCHINMLKLYTARETKLPDVQSAPSVPVLSITVSDSADEDGFVLRNRSQQCARLRNSEMLRSLREHLCHLDAVCQDDVLQLVEAFPSLFSDVPTRTSVLQHDIDVRDARPVKQHAYRVNPTKRQLMRQEVAYLLENDLAVPSTSPWSSPCLLIPKPDGTSRFCTDYRKINAVTVRDSFPLPRIDDCVDTVGAAAYVSKLDLLKGYWQVPLTPRASKTSAFVTPDSFLQYTVMPFGMCNAPATFQRLVNTVLAGVPNCTAYLDDLVVYSSNWSEHLSTLKEVFQRLAKANLTLNLAKCEFGKATITYLGKEVGRGQVRPLEEKVAAISAYPAPTTRRELRRFLGMAGYYRGFCRNFSVVVAPLTSLLSPASPFTWSESCQNAFDSVKTLLCSSPVLSAPNFDKGFKLEVDASAVGAGAVLLQEDDSGLDHPICYFSRKFSKAQSRYSTIEQETLALLLALQFFEVYLGSSTFPIDVYTDHNPLVFLDRMYNQNQRLMRWALLVQGVPLVIHHKKGLKNVVADALSRA